MTAVTLVEALVTKQPGVEVVTVTATDGYTYTSVKFATVKAVFGSLMHDAGSLSIPLSFAVSAGVITVHCTGLSGKKIALQIYGNSGN